MNRIHGKHIVVGVSGGIAAYKSCELVRRFIKEGATVQVIMTKNATEFVTPLTFQTLSANRVAIDTFDLEFESEIGHISIADKADVIVVAPATAAVIGKIASGISDNLLTTVLLATRAPVVICPTMNVNMYNNPLVQENLEKLMRAGFIVLEPEEGELACGWEGRGRLPDIGIIVKEVERILSPKDLEGQRVIVTAGATKEFIDSVRFISNPSSGKMGFALANEGWLRGAEVVLISGKTDVSPPDRINIINTSTVAEMYEEVMKRLDWATIIIKAAAVGDYAPEEPLIGKIKKDNEELTLRLKPTKDILSDVGLKKNGKLVVGFSAECENIIENSIAKLRKKRLDLIVANDITREGSGFGGDTNSVYLIDKSECVDELPIMGKDEVARRVFDKILEIGNRNNARL